MIIGAVSVPPLSPPPAKQHASPGLHKRMPAASNGNVQTLRPRMARRASRASIAAASDPDFDISLSGPAQRARDIERERCKAILYSSAAARFPAVARHLALKTSLSPEEADGIMIAIKMHSVTPSLWEPAIRNWTATNAMVK